jgi:hypothetical protein
VAAGEQSDQELVDNRFLAYDDLAYLFDYFLVPVLHASHQSKVVGALGDRSLRNRCAFVYRSLSFTFRLCGYIVLIVFCHERILCAD